MKKACVWLLAVVMVLGFTVLVSAAEVKVGGKVDFRQEMGGLNATKTGYNMKAFNLREARLTVKGTMNEKVSAQISDNFCASNVATLETNNAGIGDTYVNIALGGGNLLLGATSIPGFAIRETIMNKEILGNRLTGNAMNQVCYSGKMDPVSYAIAIVDGGVNTDGARTKDAVIGLSGMAGGATLGVAYNFDSNDDDGVKGSFFGVNAGMAVSMLDVKVQYIGGLDDTVAGANDISDATESAPKNEIVLDLGFKLGEKCNASVGYDMFGKSNAITLKADCKATDGVTWVVRADMLGSDYKKVSPAANNISLGVVAEY